MLLKNLSASFKRQVWRKLSVNKCFLAKSPVGSLPFVHREISHCGEISVRARVLPRETQRRGTLLAGFYFHVHAFLLLRKTNAVRGEKALSWQSPGGALTAFELGNAPLFGAFPDRARSLPREKEFVDFNRHYRPPAVLSLLYNKRQVWRKLSPAAQKRGFACRRIFKKRAPAKIAQRVLREEEQRASEQSREERSGLHNLLRCDEAQGNPPCRNYF